MDLYLFVKTLHVLSGTVLFGTGAGIAFFMLSGHLSGVPAARRLAAEATVRADFLFTHPAVIVQPLSGAWLVWQGGFDWSDRWLLFASRIAGMQGMYGPCRNRAIMDARGAMSCLDLITLKDYLGALKVSISRCMRIGLIRPRHAGFKRPWWIGCHCDVAAATRQSQPSIPFDRERRVAALIAMTMSAEMRHAVFA